MITTWTIITITNGPPAQRGRAWRSDAGKQLSPRALLSLVAADYPVGTTVQSNDPTMTCQEVDGVRFWVKAGDILQRKNLVFSPMQSATTITVTSV